MFRNMPLLQLFTTGRKSGKRRQTELIYMEYKDAYVIIASNGGRDQHPAWYFNLETTPQIEIEIAGKLIKAKAKTASIDEKAEMWPILIEKAAFYDDYRKQTSRDIPMVLLSPVE